MHTGHYISGAGHVTLIGWLLFGGIFTSEPPPFEATEVSVISGAEFEALLAAQRAPDQTTEVAQPEAPEVTQEDPAAVPTPDESVATPAPEQAQTPPADAAPTEVAPTPQAQVSDEVPELDQPVGDTAVLTPEVAPEAVPRPVERVAPQPVAQPDPEAAPDEVQQDAVTQSETGETPQDTQEATAPEEATSEIVTEATAAPRASSRPPGRRPAAPVRQAAETPTETPAETPAETPVDDNAAAIAAAVAEAQSVAEEPAAAAPSGPPLSAGEKESLRVAVSNCWNVDVGGRSADTVVTVAVALDRAGKVVGNVELIASTGGDDASVRSAFQAARRAILRCQRDGFPLPAEKYDHWKTVEMTFNPENMRVK